MWAQIPTVLLIHNLHMCTHKCRVHERISNPSAVDYPSSEMITFSASSRTALNLMEEAVGENNEYEDNRQQQQPATVASQ